MARSNRIRERKFVLSSVINGVLVYIPIWSLSITDAANIAIDHWDSSNDSRPDSIRITSASEFRRLFPSCEL